MSRNDHFLTFPLVFSGVYLEHVRLKQENYTLKPRLRLFVSTEDGETGANGRDVHERVVLECKHVSEDVTNQRT